jgi:hypothetical protein
MQPDEILMRHFINKVFSLLRLSVLARKKDNSSQGAETPRGSDGKIRRGTFLTYGSY